MVKKNAYNVLLLLAIVFFNTLSACDEAAALVRFENNERLYAAATWGDFSVSEEALNEGAVVDYLRYNSLGTPLTVAALRGHVPIVRLLLKRGADVACPGSRAAFMYAICAHRLECVQLLIEYDIDVNTVLIPTLGVTGLWLACRAGNEKIVEILLSRGAVIDTQSTDGVTPLMMAVAGGRIETTHVIPSVVGASVPSLEVYAKIALLLLDNWADQTIQNNKHQTAADMMLPEIERAMNTIRQQRIARWTPFRAAWTTAVARAFQDSSTGGGGSVGSKD